MSNVLDGIGDVFDDILGGGLGTILPAVLGAGAILFTGGAALGIGIPTFGAAVEGLTGSLGLGADLTSVMTGAVTQAGYGAALGGTASLVTGGDLATGAGIGAASGALSGGITGAVGDVTGQGTGMTAPATTGSGVASQAAMGAAGAATPIIPTQAPSAITGTPQPPSQITPTATPPGITPTAQPPSQIATTPNLGGGPDPNAPAGPPSAGSPTTGGSGVLANAEPGWLERNSGWLGQAAIGLGTGILNSGSQDAAMEAAKARDEQFREDMQANYRGRAGLLTASNDAGRTNAGGRPNPSERYDPSTTGGEWEYDPQEGRIRFRRGKQGGSWEGGGGGGGGGGDGAAAFA